MSRWDAAWHDPEAAAVYEWLRDDHEIAVRLQNLELKLSFVQVGGGGGSAGGAAWTRVTGGRQSRLRNREAQRPDTVERLSPTPSAHLFGRRAARRSAAARLGQARLQLFALAARWGYRDVRESSGRVRRAGRAATGFPPRIERARARARCRAQRASTPPSFPFTRSFHPPSHPRALTPIDLSSACRSR